MQKKENSSIQEFASIIKNDVKTIKNKLDTHNLLIESIEVSNAKNLELLSDSKGMFNKTIQKLKKDPRNYLIGLLLFTAVTLTYYLSP
ncbi:target snare coiled-coil region protein [Tubulinosema ratisbonensis]|uniref:Target snare coiled-coil region protein n=1 Tax=Tubulinosema ratisbonensis TaxID=291195 RepID=A0A437ANF5_9MICR|nr:target snare coiled-coil region protein [Tubulinosema ratisbonensis]